MSPDYFKVMQAPLMRGRYFTEGDEDGKQRVAIIDETTARNIGRAAIRWAGGSVRTESYPAMDDGRGYCEGHQE